MIPRGIETKKPIFIRKVGNSLIISISEIAKDLGLREGDAVSIVRTPKGFEVAPYDDKFDKAVHAVRKFMHKYLNALRKLAE